MDELNMTVQACGFRAILADHLYRFGPLSGAAESFARD
jgi:hypothetical protein